MDSVEYRKDWLIPSDLGSRFGFHDDYPLNEELEFVFNAVPQILKRSRDSVWKSRDSIRPPLPSREVDPITWNFVGMLADVWVKGTGKPATCNHYKNGGHIGEYFKFVKACAIVAGMTVKGGPTVSRVLQSMRAN